MISKGHFYTLIALRRQHTALHHSRRML